MTTDEQNEKGKGSLLIALAIYLTIMIGLVVFGIAMDAKKTQAELALQKCNFELLESWKGNYRLMEAVNTQESENKELAAFYEGQTVELNQYKNVVVAITEDMVQLNQEITLE